MGRLHTAALVLAGAAAVLLSGCYAKAATAQPPGSFRPREGALVMLMNKGHAERTSDGRQLWAVQRPLTYRTHAGDYITVPAGMQTDLASIPSVVQGVLPSDGPYVQGAVIHDFLFKTTGSCVWTWRGKLPGGKPFAKTAPKSCTRAAAYTRQEANAVLDQAMADLGVSTWRRWLIMDGLYVGSAAGWGK